MLFQPTEPSTRLASSARYRKALYILSVCVEKISMKKCTYMYVVFATENGVGKYGICFLQSLPGSQRGLCVSVCVCVCVNEAPPTRRLKRALWT